MTDDIRAILSHATVDVATAARAVGIAKNAAYRACRDGSLPSIRFGGAIRVPTAPLRDMLGISARDATAPAPVKSQAA